MRNLYIFALFAVTVLAGCKKKLPACDSSNTKDLLNQIIHEKIKLPELMLKLQYTYQGIGGHAELSFDAKSEKRICTMELTSDKVREKLFYQVTWIDKKKKRFEVRLLGNGYPTCTSFYLVSQLRDKVSAKLGGKPFTLSGVKEEKSDGKVRVCSFNINDGTKSVRAKIAISSTSPYEKPTLKLLRK